jgi:phosphoglycerol transferase MdoB-like AlkP superfamily enzyme
MPRLLLLTTAVLLLASCVARLGIYLAHGDFFAGIAIADFALAAFRGLRYDMAALALLLLPPLLLILLPGQFWALRWLRNSGYVFLTVAAAATVLFGVASTQFFAFFYRHLGVEVKTVFSDFDFILQMAVEQNLAALIVVIIGLILAFVAGYRVIPRLPAPQYGFAGYSWRLALVLVIGHFSLWGQPGREWVDDKHAFVEQDLRLGQLVLNPAFAAFNNLFFPQSVTASLAGVPEAQATLPPATASGQPLLASSGVSRPNIVMVILESWTPDFIGAFGAEESITPHFDAIAAEGRRYQQAYANGPISIYGLQAILSGMPHLPGMPLMGFGGVETLQLKGVAQLAAEAGYETLWAQAPRRASFNMDTLAARWGFEHIAGREDFQTPEDWNKTPFGWDWPMYEYALQRLAEFEAPFFATLYTGVTHVPYVQVPAEHELRPHNPDTVDGFINTLSRADWALNQFWQQARRSAWHANTVYLFVSDHVVPKDMPDKSVRGRYRIPLLIVGPGIEAGDDRQTASHIDLLPTVAQLTGATIYAVVRRQPALSSDGAMSYFLAPENVLGHYRNKPVFAADDGELLAPQEAAFLSRLRASYERYLALQ